MNAKQTLYSGLAFSQDGAHLYASMGSLTNPEGDGDKMITASFGLPRQAPNLCSRLCQSLTLQFTGRRHQSQAAACMQKHFGELCIDLPGELGQFRTWTLLNVEVSAGTPNSLRYSICFSIGAR